MSTPLIAKPLSGVRVPRAWRQPLLLCAIAGCLATPATAADTHRLDWAFNVGTLDADGSEDVSADPLGVYISGQTEGSPAVPNPTPGIFDAFLARYVSVPEPASLPIALTALFTLSARRHRTRPR